TTPSICAIHLCTALYYHHAISISPLPPSFLFFFFNATAPTDIYTLSLHDALPILRDVCVLAVRHGEKIRRVAMVLGDFQVVYGRSEEHTSELQSRFDLVCRLLLEKKKKK